MHIPADIVPIAHVPPLRRIDPQHPGRKAVITLAEVQSGACREPDAAIYRWSYLGQAWYLKDGA